MHQSGTGNKADLASGVAAGTEVHVWIVPVRPDNSPLRRFHDVLSSQEAEQARRFIFQKDRNRYVAAHGALRLILGRYAGEPPEKLSFDREANGKPFLRRPAGGNLRYNLSHSGEYALVAVGGRRRVGVDVESVRTHIDCLKLSRRFFTPAENAWLEARAPENLAEGFFRLWVLKEAFLKALGAGLSVPLSEIDIVIHPDDSVELKHARDRLAGSRWQTVEMKPAAAYPAALVVERGAGTLRTWRLNGCEASEMVWTQAL